MIIRRIYFYAIIVFALDQGTKVWVLHFLKLDSLLRVTIIPGYANFHMAWNDGINFGIFGSGNPLVKWGLVLVAILICAGITWWARDENRRVQQIFVALIIGGAIGNVFDRIIYGAVADFINISCCGIKNPYSFNIADVAIFFGAFGLIISSEKKLS